MSKTALDQIEDGDTVERIKTQTAGLKWLYEMELLQSPQLINNLKLNILYISPAIKHTELLIDQNTKGLLIYIKLSLWGRIFHRAKIIMAIEDVITQVLPSYRKRVITDKKILNMALQLAKGKIGGNNESNNKKSNTTNIDGPATGDAEPKGSESDGLPEASDILPDKKEQKINATQESNEAEQCNIQGDEETQSSS